MSQVRFELMTTVYEWAKTVHALGGASTVTGVRRSYECTNVISVLSILKNLRPSFQVRSIRESYGVCVLLYISF
jgi:hypothetical protein